MKCERCGGKSKKKICKKCEETKGYKNDGGKVRPALIGIHAIRGLAAVLAFGANKYSDDNWRHGMRWRRVADALMRHLLAYLGGEDRDQETGLPHIDHLLCNAMFLSEYFHTKTGVDDRWKGIPNEPVHQPAGQLDVHTHSNAGKVHAGGAKPKGKRHIRKQ